MRKTRFGAVSLLVLGLGGCGPEPAPVTPQPAPPVSVKPAADAPTTTANAGTDLSPVPEPSDIVGLARWRNPIATASNLASCAGVAPILVEVNARMGVNLLLAEVLRRSIDTKKLAGVVALDAPVDVLVTLDPQARMRPPNVAVAIGLSTLDGAKAAIAPEGQQPPEIAPGLWRLKGERGIACGVAASAGSTPARLVCTDREKTLTALAPYLARTLPSVDLGGPDVHVEARVDVLRKRYGEGIQNNLQTIPGSVATEWGIGDKKYDGKLFDDATAVQEDAQKLFGDLNRVTAEVRSERNGTCLRATADVDLGTKTSWLAGTLADRIDRSAPPPAIYWRLPADSQAAFYGRGVDPARFTSVLTNTRELLEAGLAHDGFGSAADRKKVVDLIDLPFGKDTNVVVSHGPVNVTLPDPSAPSKGGPAKGASAGSSGLVKVAEATATRMIGWTILGADEGPAAMKKQLKAALDAYKLAGVQSGLKKELGPSDAKHLPTVKTGTAPASLGAGAEAIEITIPDLEAPVPSEPGKPAPRMAIKLHLLLMGDGNASWLALGGSKDELVKRLLAVKKDADAKGQLGSRAGLESLKEGKQMLGGFVSASLSTEEFVYFAQHANAVDPGWVLSPEFFAAAKSFQTLPNRGATPIILAANGTAGTTTKLSLAIDVQQGTFEDAKAIVIANYSLLRNLGFLP